MAKNRNSERGQALVEFSLVLPVLVIFTVGSILLGIYFTQRSTMTGLTFIAAREAAMSPNAQEGARRVQRGMARGGPDWMKDTKVTARTGSREVTVTATQSGNMNLPLLAAAGEVVAPGSKPLDRFADIEETVLMSSEVIRRPGAHGHHPRTANVIDYRRKLGLKLGSVQLTPDLEKIPGAAALLRQVAPHGDDMTQAQRQAAASGCAEDSSGACAGGPGNQNLNGPDGFYAKMGFNQKTGQVEGTITDLLPALRAGQAAQSIGATKGLKAWIATNPELAGLLKAVSGVAGGARKFFDEVAGLNKEASEIAFTNPATPLAQWGQGQP